jgi:hypothetical protein
LAVRTLKANGKVILKKTFFAPGTSVKVGNPIAVIGADGENIPYGNEYASVEIGFWDIAPSPLIFKNPLNLRPSNSLKS